MFLSPPTLPPQPSSRTRLCACVSCPTVTSLALRRDHHHLNVLSECPRGGGGVCERGCVALCCVTQNRQRTFFSLVSLSIMPARKGEGVESRGERSGCQASAHQPATAPRLPGRLFVFSRRAATYVLIHSSWHGTLAEVKVRRSCRANSPSGPCVLL